MASLGTLLVRIAAEGIGKYKADMADAAHVTEGAAGKIEQSTGKAGTAAGKLGDALDKLGVPGGKAAGDLAGAAVSANGLNAGMLVAVGSAGLLVAALAGAAFAAHQGAQEQRAYEKALIMSGNAAGTNASQMQAMAASVSKVVGTQYEAAAALAQMAGTGQVAAGNLEKFSLTAVEMERTVGQSVGDTVKVFSELGSEPVKASLKLNESMNYLTASTFEQIKAAEDLGDKEKAASLAQNAYADAMKTRTAQIEANLGTLERAWRGVGAMGKWAWDQMLGIGRKAGPDQALEAAKGTVANLETLLAKGGTATPDIQRKLDAAKQNLSLMQENVKLSERASQSQADQAASEKAKIGWMQEGDKYLSKREKSEQAIARIRFEGAAAGANELEIEKRVAIERAKGADKPVASKKPQIDENEKLIASIRDGMAATQAEVELGQKLTPVQKEIATLYAKISSSKTKYTQETLLTVDALMQEKLANEQANTVREAGRKALELASKERQKAIDVIEKDTASLQDQIRKQQDANASIGLSKRAIAELTRQRELDAAAILEAKAIKELDRNLDYEKYEATMAQVRAMRELANLKGEGGALETAYDEAKKAGEEWKKFTDDIGRGLTDSLYRAFEAGKGFFDSLWSGIKNMFKTTVLKLAVQAVGGGVSSVLGLDGGSAGGGAGGAMNIASGLSSASGLYAAGSYFVSGATGVMTGAAAGMGATLPGSAVGIGAMGSGAGGFGSALGAMGPYGWVALAALAAFAIFSGDKDPASVSTGDTSANYDKTGKRTSSTNSFGFESSQTIAATDALQKSYMGMAASLGIGTVDSNFGVGGNSDGKVSHFGIGANAGGLNYTSADNLEYSEAAYQLEASRAIMTALKGSELPRYLTGVFDNITASSATQEQINNVLAYAGALKAFDATLQLMPFDNLRDQSYAAMQGLIGASGGLEALQANLGYYFENFYGEGERAAVATASLAAQFAALGIAVPDNAAQLRDLIAAQDISTAAGQNMAASLLGLAPAFQNVAAAARASAQQMMSVMASYASAGEQRQYQIEQIRQGLAAGGVDISSDLIGSASRDQAWQSYKDLVAAGDTRRADAVFSQLDAFAKLTAAAPEQSSFYLSSGGGGGASSSGSNAAASIANAWQAITDSIWGEVKRIRGLLEGSGQDAFAAAQARFTIATAQARAGDQDAAKALPQLSQALLALADTNVGTLLELKRIQGQTAASLTETNAGISGKYGTTIPSFDVGTNYVPRDMLAMIHEGEAIIPRAYNPTANGGGNSNAETANALRRMADRLDAIEANTRAGAQHGGKTARLIERVMPDGDAIQMRETPKLGVPA